MIKRRTIKTLKDINSVSHYRNIIYLTMAFQDPKNRGPRNNDKNRGLEQIHYRYALQQGFQTPKNYARKRQELNHFFGRKLEVLRSQGYLEADAIKQGNTLSIFLRKLVRDYGILERKRVTGNIYRYVVAPALYGLIVKDQTVRELDNAFNLPEFTENLFMPEWIEKAMPNIPCTTFMRFCSMGMPEHFFDGLSEEQRRYAMECLNDIYRSVIELANIKALKSNKNEIVGFYCAVVARPKQ